MNRNINRERFGYLPEEGESWDPNNSEPAKPQNVPVKPLGSLTQRDPVLRDRLTDLMAKGLSLTAPDDFAARRMARDTMQLGEDWNPLVATAMSGGDFYDAAKRGDASDMAWAGANIGVNALGLKKGAQTLTRDGQFAWGDWDPFKPKVQHTEKGLPGAPSHVPGPVPEVASAAEKYASGRGTGLDRQKEYAEADPERGRYIAEAYDKMKHDPSDPRVKASYDALSKETMAQWQALQDAGAKIEFLKPGQPDPYPNGPRDALADLQSNHHLYVFPTEQGFGSSGADVSGNPLLADTGIEHGGHRMLVNDAFRAVHDYFGHGMEGANFGARGEENAWRAHKRLFSPEAVPALTSETRGQNSWVNFGPYGEANRANMKDTVFADQKTGLLPSWAYREGGMPLKHRLKQSVGPAIAAGYLGTGLLEEEE